MSNQDDTMLSRSGRTDPGGKCGMRMDIPMPEDLYDEIIRLAANARISKTECARNLLSKIVFGEAFIRERISKQMASRPSDECPMNNGD